MVQIDEHYAQQFQEMIKAFQPKAVKLILVKNNLNEEIVKRIDEIKITPL